MELELRHLRAIRSIAETGSLTKAAGKLGVAQAALSTQLKRIERSLGGPLFLRDSSGARPTQLGELVLQRALVVLPAVEELQEAAIRFANVTRSGTAVARFRVGGTHGPLLGALVDRLASARPEAQVELHTTWSVDDLSRLLIAGRLDYSLIGVCGHSPPPASDQLTWRPLGTDPVFVMLADRHPYAHLAELDLSLLAKERWVSAPGDGCFADCFATACARAGFTPLPLYETDALACTHLVQAGRAVGLCRATFPAAPGLVVRPLTGAPLSWRHLLGWHPASPSASPANEVLDHARTAYRDVAGGSADFARWLTGHPGFGVAS